MSDDPQKATVTELDPKKRREAEAERKAQEDQMKAQLELQIQQNQMAIEANQKAAMDWIKDNKGQAVMLAMDPDGTYHTWVLGNADTITKFEPKITSNLFNMFMMLVGTHLPGSSVAAHAMHEEYTKRLQAMQHNLEVIAEYLKATNPNVRVAKQDLDGKPIVPDKKLITP